MTVRRVRRIPFSYRKYYIAFIVIILIVIYTFVSLFSSDKLYEFHRTTTLANRYYFHSILKKNLTNNEIIPKDLYHDTDFRSKLLQQKMERLERKYNKSRSILLNSKPMLQPNYNVHIFYYGWYRNIEHDGFYRHWNHEYLDNWKNDKDKNQFPTGTHSPPNDIGSNYYPVLGCYSSADETVMEIHLKQIRDAGIGIVIFSWVPSNFSQSDDEILGKFFEIAWKHGIKIALHVEPYPGRNPINLRNYLNDFFKKYRNHPALYKIQKPLGTKFVPVIYIYDSYLIPAVAWKELLSTKGNISVRGGELDAIYIGLLVEMQHKYHIKKSQFDGFYTYFATNSFTYGSTWKNWGALSKFAVHNGLIFIPSVGPGYIDVRVRPWNGANMRPRRHGHYYDVAWRSAINNNANYVSITSFNEWHEGTQIEPAQTMKSADFTYMDYQPEGPNFYLNLTKAWIKQFAKTMA